MTANHSSGLAGRVALVTGGGRGIGRAITLALATRGATIAVNYHRDEASAKATVADAEALGATAHAYRASVDVADECEAMVEAVQAELGPVSILVNNAGQSTKARFVVDLDPEEAEETLRAHALGPLRLCQLVLPGMRTQPRGDIVMISSSAPRLNAPRTAVYTMAKSAMESLAFVLAKEEVRHGIRVNVVAPGLVATQMGAAVVKGIAGPDADVTDLDSHAPFGRVCRPEDVAGVVAFLVSDSGSYVTGECIRVDGGAPGFAGPPRSRA